MDNDIDKWELQEIALGLVCWLVIFGAMIIGLEL
jgi:hypothetical protein